MCPFHSGSLLLTLLNWLQLCRRSNLVMRGVDLVWVWSIWFVSAFVKTGYNDRSHANWVRGGEYSLRWPLYFVEAALQRCSFLAATIRPHHSTPDLQSTKGRPREQEQKTRKSATGEKNPEKYIWRNSLKEPIRAAWYAEHTLYQLVTFEDRDRIQKQARVSEVLQSSATIKSWWVSDTFSIREEHE